MPFFCWSEFVYCWILCCWLLYSVWPNKETPTQHLLWISIKRTVFEGMTRKSVEIHPRSALRNHFIALFFRSAIHDGRSDEIHPLQSASWVFTAALQTVYRLYEFNFHMCHSIACYKNHTVAETIRFIWEFFAKLQSWSQHHRVSLTLTMIAEHEVFMMLNHLAIRMVKAPWQVK